MNEMFMLASLYILTLQLPGQGQAQPLPYTKHDFIPYRVGAGLAPALGILAKTPIFSQKMTRILAMLK